MLLQIAWRNVWRSPARSLVVIVASALGLWAGLFMISFSMGMSDQRAKDQIETQISHVQVHHPEFADEREATKYMENGLGIIQRAKEEPGVINATGRTLAYGMASSARKGQGVMINGVEPASEAIVTKLDQKLIEGTYFTGVKRNPIIISEKTAKDLDLKLRKKMVLTFQDANGDVTAYAFRVVGLYKTVSSKYDEGNVFIRAQDLQKMLGIPGAYHEIAVLADDKDAADPIKASLSEDFPEAKVETWKDLSPELRLTAESMDQFMWIFVGIIVMALTFSIINTMLMAVLERTHELGMLMAVGMSRLRVFSMIMLETVFLSMVGVPLGLLAAWGSITYLGGEGRGLDLSAFADGLSEFGMSSVIQPQLDGHFYWQVMLLVAFASTLAAVYPAIRALKLKPVEAIRAH